MNTVPRDNHFIWLRYLAAFSIVFSHSRQFNTAPADYSDIVATLTWLFPGVPILFFISGFLISLSSAHSANFTEYFIKRVLRIYPPLWAAFVVSIILLFSTGMLPLQEVNWLHFFFWCIGQVTFIFVYHPEFLSHIGTGVLNGSLWAIPVILQFYLLIPVLKKIDELWLQQNKPHRIYVLLVACALVNMVFHYLHNTNPNMLLKVIHFLTIIPWLFFFVLGYVFSRDFNRIISLSKHWLPWLMLHVVVFFSLRELGFRWGRNDINPLLFSVLALVIIQLAFVPKSSLYWFNRLETFLARNDISFGLFVYHMLVLNTMIYFGIFENCWSCRMLVFISVTILVSIFSLLVLEKPIKNQRSNLIAFFSNRLKVTRD
ncbi:acyltransferase [Alkalimonas collagenimarina]|uniref:Acyltransferase n=1 Tax=Alkalimonas collagenimarina TaxID=400390 RepID=A0ABT9GZ67_9GAMM|nr:acyltransferase [Alkalimonas collagenimarina]MDP4536359.1 acyltransferase [Alkalimonas collagenimarina]